MQAEQATCGKGLAAHAALPEKLGALLLEREAYDRLSKDQHEVATIEPNKRIVIEWDGYSGRTLVDWKFAPQKDGSTFVSITESGWTGSADDLLKYVADSTQGFTWTLAGLKALLEHDIQLNLVADRFPKGVDEP